MKKEKYKIFNDSYHGWIEIPIDKIIELSLQKEISEYSYINKEFIYLEEDADATLFIKTFIKKFHYSPEFVEIYQEISKVRKYKSYNYLDLKIRKVL